ncbi:hypothetical protein K491DRAFT_777825 [Lophiostoma macrostomum CBS 122681]|uniref:Rhodopsin domain-containing protein n=1 Tax=Lophiostoma macrostomum CBS 122681 TaxID=1314788 RepID=A0A6A6TCE4_9PLEO|nr:hypothetical protein K491DRAFT_777825 [Lophiostoma macrostomum CBS 122681]
MELYAVAKGFGRHSKFLSTNSLVQALKYMQIGVVMATFAILSIKVSVCFFLLALLRDTHKRFRLFIWILMAFTTITTFIGLLLWGLQAHPIEKLWDPRVKGSRGSSHDFLHVVYVFYAFNLFTDAVYSLTPIWFLWNIQISKKKKYSIWAMMGSGLLLVAVVSMCIAFAPEFLEIEDITWALVPEFIADSTQRHLSGIIANLPALYMLMNRAHSPTPPSSTPSSRISKLLRGFARSDSKPSQSSLGSIRKDKVVQVSNQQRQSQNPYSMRIETDEEIPLKERAVRPSGFQ